MIDFSTLSSLYLCCSQLPDSLSAPVITMHKVSYFGESIPRRWSRGERLLTWCKWTVSEVVQAIVPRCLLHALPPALRPTWQSLSQHKLTLYAEIDVDQPAFLDNELKGRLLVRCNNVGNIEQLLNLDDLKCALRFLRAKKQLLGQLLTKKQQHQLNAKVAALWRNRHDNELCSALGRSFSLAITSIKGVCAGAVVDFLCLCLHSPHLSPLTIFQKTFSAGVSCQGCANQIVYEILYAIGQNGQKDHKSWANYALFQLVGLRLIENRSDYVPQSGSNDRRRLQRWLRRYPKQRWINLAQAYYISVETEGDGHTLGLYKPANSAKCLLFDPNYGLFAAGRNRTQILHILKLLLDHYPSSSFQPKDAANHNLRFFALELPPGGSPRS